jgi:hypothetical protein
MAGKMAAAGKVYRIRRKCHEAGFRCDSEYVADGFGQFLVLPAKSRADGASREDQRKPSGEFGSLGGFFGSRCRRPAEFRRGYLLSIRSDRDAWPDHAPAHIIGIGVNLAGLFLPRSTCTNSRLPCLPMPPWRSGGRRPLCRDAGTICKAHQSLVASIPRRSREFGDDFGLPESAF